MNESIAFYILFSQNIPTHFNPNFSRMIFEIDQERKKAVTGCSSQIH